MRGSRRGRLRGSVSTVVGGGVALALLQLTGTSDAGYAAVALSAVLPYLGAAVVVAGLDRAHLGPDHATLAARLSARDVAAGMVAGARHVLERPPATAAMLAMALLRLGYGFLALMTLLLYRNTFESWGPLFPAGLMGLGEVLAAGAVGTLVAAGITPWVVRHIGKQRWITFLMAGAGLSQVALGLPFLPPTTVLAGLLIGFVGQGVKICVDSTLQESVADDFRGRVFSVYDTLFNVTVVAALLVAAFLLPPSGVSYALLVSVGAGYLAGAAAYAHLTRRH